MDTSLHTRLQSTLGESYIVERELPPGGMSRLFLATERSLARNVVIKVLPPEMASELSAQRFQREILVTAKLQHAHILPVLSAGVRGGLLYYITPYIAGESLRHRLAHEGALPIEDALLVMREMADALAFAHGQGVVHRDLKPENILLQHGHVVLADFGIARALEEAATLGGTSRLTGTGMGIGTPGYMAPEQLAGDTTDARADIYAFGIVSYEVLAGQAPFAGFSAAKLLVAQMTETPERLSRLRAAVSPELEALVMRALEKDPSHRWQTAAELVSGIQAIIAGERAGVRATVRASAEESGAEALRAALDAFDACRWREAFELLSKADESRELQPEHLEHLADAAWWTGRSDDCIRARERAYTGYLEKGDERHAAGMAIALAEDHMHKLSRAVSRGWLQRAERHLAELPESIEHGWLMRTRTVAAFEGEGNHEKALACARETMEIARRLDDRNLQVLALQDQGRILVSQGELTRGMALIDEAMAATTGGQLDPRTTGRTYCNMMSTCEKLADYRRALEWNDAARHWCEPNGGTGYPGICRVHRAELLKLRGAWPEAEAEARKASEDLEGFLDDVAAEAIYEVGEVRLRMGDFAAAEEMFRQAHERGRDPLPGLALLRLAQGRADSARSLIDRALEEPGLSPLKRARLLPSQVEAAVATRDLEAARAATEELEAIAEVYRTPALAAHAAVARGTFELASGRARDAAVQLRRACRLWKEADLPYEIARTRVLLATAYHASGDREDAALELQAASSSFERLGATADMRRTADLLPA